MTNFQKAKQLGYEVQVRHGRFNHLCYIDEPGCGKHLAITFSSNTKDFNSLYGGETLAYVYDNQGNAALGIAECSIKDKFNRRLGTEIAVGRALKKLQKGLRKSQNEATKIETTQALQT